MTAENIESKKWEGVIADLTAKAAKQESELSELVKSRDALALDAELGVSNAKAQLQKLQSDITTKSNQSGIMSVAIQQARAKLTEAKKAEAQEKERQRQEQLRSIFTQFLGRADNIDVNLEQLAKHLAASKFLLQEAAALMPADEQKPIQALMSRNGPSLAACFYGLQDHLEMGSIVTNITHRAPMGKFARSWLEQWIGQPETETKKEEAANGQ